MRKLLENKLFVAVLSTLISLSLWFYVAAGDTDEITKKFNGVKVELYGEDILQSTKNLAITDREIERVNVEVRGPRRVIGVLNSEDLVAKLDVSKLTRTSYASLSYTIEWPVGTNTNNITIVKKSPESISFSVSSIGTKSVPVRGSFDGNLGDGFSAEVPKFDPATVVVTGPEQYLKDIAYAWVTFGKDQLVDKTYSDTVSFTLMDEAGNPVDTKAITASVDNIVATLPILKVKTVPISVSLVEGAGATAENSKVKITPAEIILAGDSEIIDSINKVTIATIDLTDFGTTYSDEFPIVLDERIKNQSGFTSASVTVEITGLSTKKLTVDNISYINVTDGYTCEVVTEQIDVTIRGTEEELANIGPENVRAVADFVDFNESAGTYTVNAKIHVDGFTDVGAIGYYQITVNMKKN